MLICSQHKIKLLRQNYTVHKEDLYKGNKNIYPLKKQLGSKQR